MPITIIIPVLDEASQIEECVRHVSWADEIVVADGGSRDDTVAVARGAGATVLEKTGPTIAAQRNSAIAAARNEWIFAIDADERIPDALREEIAATMLHPRHAAYRVRRRSFYLGREQTRGRWGRDWVVRLFTRERRYVLRRVHEGLEPVSDVGSLKSPLAHDPYRDLSHQLEKMNRYAYLGAQDLYDQGRRANLTDLAGRPLARFLRAYLIDGACRDGLAGLVEASLGGCTAFLKYAHLWALERRVRA
ncbi:MAG: glycosyltransferase family 2 protein [Gemmatimonadales bacterium]